MRSDKKRLEQPPYHWWQNLTECQNFFAENHRPSSAVFKQDGKNLYWRSDIFEINNNELYFYLFLDVQFAETFAKTLAQYYVKDKHIKVTFDATSESPLMWPFSSWARQLPNFNPADIFRTFHDIVDDAGVPESIVYLYTGNMCLKEIYIRWCQDNNVTNKMNVAFADHWALDTIETNKSIYNSYTPSNRKNFYFTSMNHKPRPHRLSLLNHLYENNLLDKGVCTFAFDELAIQCIGRKNQELASILPMTLEGNDAILDPAKLYKAIDNSYYDLVTETFTGRCYDEKVFDSFFKEPYWRNIYFTEKTYKSILYKKPFLFIGAPGQLEVLRQFGFRTFPMLFDESYDQIENHKDRIQAVLEENKRIINTYTLDELHDKINNPEIQSILEHNRSHLHYFSELYSLNYKNQITDILSETTYPT